MATKSTLILFLILAFFDNQAYSQKNYFHSKPDGICGKDALIGNCVPCGYDNTNFGDAEEFNALAWTNGGAISNHRSLIQFDFTSIPPGSIVASATLHLFYNPTSSNASGFHSNLSGSNDSYIMKITSPWDEHTVTWNNQPSVTSVNEAYLSTSISNTQDYLVNVTAIVQDFIDNPSQNYGMMIKLATESYYRCLLFATSDHPNSQLHPEIEVRYSPAQTSCYTLQNGACDGIDALIGNCMPCGYDTSNFGNIQEFNALAWTNGGAISNQRSLIQWNLENIPTNATVQSASLSLYFNSTSSNASGLHSTISGLNNSYLKKITSPWDENTLTWNNQPSVTTVNQAPLPSSTSPTQDYLNINVTSLVQDMITNPATNFGLMLQLDVESYYRCLLFASSDHPNESKHPKLEICYSFVNSVNENVIHDSEFEIFPNPSLGTISIQFNNLKSRGTFEIVDVIGQSIFEEKINSSQRNISFDLSKGIYWGILKNDSSINSKKIIIY